MELINDFYGTIRTLHFIFVRCCRRYSDLELLEKLGVHGYVRTKEPPADLAQKICVTDDIRWTHVADDWSYTLWRTPEVGEAMARLAAQHDIFSTRRKWLPGSGGTSGSTPGRFRADEISGHQPSA